MDAFSIKENPKYIEVRVDFKIEAANGKIKSQSVTYLVDALTVTEAESKMVKYLSDEGEKAFSVKATKPSRIFEVVA